MSHGKICYLEIPAITAEASAGFYSSIFGWTVRKRGDGALAFDDTGGVSGTWVKESDRTPDEQTSPQVPAHLPFSRIRRAPNSEYTKSRGASRGPPNKMCSRPRSSRYSLCNVHTREKRARAGG